MDHGTGGISCALPKVFHSLNWASKKGILAAQNFPHCRVGKPKLNHRPFVFRFLWSQASRKAIALSLTAALSVAIFVLALIPLELPPAMPGTDKLHHLVAFAALTLPCAALYPRALFWVLPAIVLQAGLIEIVQPYVNRMREWADFVADMKGMALGLCFGLALRSVGAMMALRGATGSK